MTNVYDFFSHGNSRHYWYYHGNNARTFPYAPGWKSWNRLPAAKRRRAKSSSISRLLVSGQTLAQKLLHPSKQQIGLHLMTGHKLEQSTGIKVGGDISGGKQARAKKIFSNLTKVRMLNKTVEILSLQHYSFCCFRNFFVLKIAPH